MYNVYKLNQAVGLYLFQKHHKRRHCRVDQKHEIWKENIRYYNG